MIATILMYGIDPSLLWKSRLILEQTGARIFTTMHFEQKIELMGTENGSTSIVNASTSCCQLETVRSGLNQPTINAN